MEKICAVYKITNTITGDFYIGSSKDIKQRWANHKCPSTWNKYPNNPMYHDMKNYGTDKFVFEVIEEAEESFLKEKEQQFIEMLKPTYNSNRANGFDFERRKKYNKEYQKEYHKEYEKSDKRKKYKKEYYNQLCFYNGETLTLRALVIRFSRAGIEHPQIEAKKYLLH